MRLLLRFGIFALLFGFIAGLIARRALGTHRLPEVLLATLLPWAVHLIYVLRRVIVLNGFGVGVFLVPLVSIALAFGLLLFAPRLYRNKLTLAALVPVALAAMHGVILLIWSSSLSLTLSPTLVSVGFVWMTLFVSAGLWAYALPSPRIPNIGGLGRRR